MAETVDLILNIKPGGDGNAKLRDLTRSMNEMEREARETQQAIIDMQRAGRDTAALERSLKTVQGAMAKLRHETELAKKPFVDLQTQANKTREQMEKFAQVGSRVAMLGAAITAPLVLSLKSYVDKFKESEPLAKRMADNQARFADVSERIGRVLASEILPFLEQAADVADRLADFVEANPWVAKAAMSVGALLTVGGGLIMAVSQIAGTIATIQGLGAGSALAGGGAAAGAAAGGAGAALGTVALYASAVILGAGIGEALGNAINRATGQQEADPGIAAAQLFQVSLTGWAAMFRDMGLISDDAFEKFRMSTLSFFNLAQETQKATTETQKATTATGQLAAALTQSNAAQQQAVTVAMTLTNAYSGVGKSLADLQSDVANFASEAASREAERAAQRNEIIANAEKEARRAAEDHQKALAQIERRRQSAVADAAENRDALAIDRANEAAAEETEIENEKYAMSARRRAEDLKDQLKAFDKQSQAQRAADIRKLQELQAVANAELLLVQQAEAAKLAVFQSVLAQIQALGNQALFGGTTTPTGDTYAALPPASADTYGGGSRQTVNIQMANGQTMSQVRREISRQNSAMVRQLSRALGGV
jgi:hypothetical protein